MRGTKPLLQFYAPRLSLEAKHNLAKRYKNCARGKTKKPQMPGYTSTHLIHYIYTKLASFGSSKKKYAETALFAAIFFISKAAKSRFWDNFVNVFSGFYIAGKANLMYNIAEE